MDSDFNRLSRLQRRNAALESDDEEFPAPSTLSPIRVPLLAPRRAPRISHPLQHPHPRPPPTPSTGMPSSLPQHSLPLSAPASPPTPIPTPSPKPHQRIPIWDTRDEEEDSVLTDAKIRFSQMDPMARQIYLRDLLSMCDMQQLSFVHHFVSPKLKKDPFRILPTELCLEVGLRMNVSIGRCFLIPVFTDIEMCRRSQNPSAGLTSIATMARSFERRLGLEGFVREED